MSALARKSLRLRFVNTAPAQTGLVIDQTTAGAPIVWRSADLLIAVAVYDAATGTGIMDLSAFTALTLELRPYTQKSSGVFWSKANDALSFDATPADAAWLAGTEQHATFALTDDEMRVDLDNGEQRQFWLVLGGTTTSGSYIVIASGGPFTIVESGFNATGSVVGISNVFSTGTVDAGTMSEAVTYSGLTTGGHVEVHKTSSGPAIDYIAYSADTFTVYLTGPAPAGGVTFKYKVDKL